MPLRASRSLSRQQVSQIAKTLGAVGLYAGRHLVDARCRGRSLALRVREHVDLREPAGTGDAERVLELPFRLAGEAADYVGRQRQLGNALVQVGDNFFEMLGAVRAVHLAKHLRIARLKGEVKMPADAPAGRCEHLDQIVVHVARLDARNAEAHGIFPFFMQVSRLFEEHPQKIGKAGRLPRLLVTPTVGSEVYPGEDDFLHAGTRKRAALAHDLAGIHAGRLPARDVHDAVGAGIVAAVLDLYAHAGAVTFPNGKRGPVRRNVKSPCASIDRGCKARLSP